MATIPQRRARLSIDVDREDRRRLHIAAAKRDQSIRDYVWEAVEARLVQDLEAELPAADLTALTERGLRAASRISAATGVRLLAETFPARMERGAGVPNVDRLAYLIEVAEAQLTGVRHLVLAGARSPVSFFAYPGQDQVAHPGQLGLGHLDQVGQPVHVGHPGAALHPRRERLGEQPRPGRRAHPAGRPQAALGERPAAEQEHRGSPGRAIGRGHPNFTMLAKQQFLLTWRNMAQL